MATSPVPPIAARNALPKRSSTLGRLIRPLLSLLVLVVVAVASATTTWLWTTRSGTFGDSAPHGEAGASTSETVARVPATPFVPPVPIFLALDPFTVSLQSADMERMLHVRIALRVDDDTTRQRFERYMPEVRNRVLLLLSAQSPHDIITPQGKTALAEAVRQTLTQPFAPVPDAQSLRDVLFTEFVVQ